MANANSSFVIGGTPVKPIDEFSEEAKYFEEEYVKDPENYVQPEIESTEVVDPEKEVSAEDGEFAGYKLGNVYRKKSENIKDYENMKDVPIDILVTKGDPTRL